MFLEHQLHWESMGLIDLDGSYVIQLVVFLIFLALMNFLLFKPLMRVIDERRKKTEGTREDARESDVRARKMVADYEDKLAQAMVKGAELRSELRDTAATEAQKTVGAARNEFTEKVASGTAAAKSDYEKACTSVVHEAKPLADAIAARLLDTSRKAQ